MDSVPVIIVGIIGLVSVGCQLNLYYEDEFYYGDEFRDFPTRLKSGLAISGIILIGITFYSSYMLFDPEIENYSLLSAAKNIGLALIFGFLFTIKSYFGPIVLGYLAGYSVYMFFEHDQLIIAPVVDWLLSLLFLNVPPGWDMAYTIALSLYLIAVSGIDFHH